MSDILSQDEIDKLLNAAASGSVGSGASSSTGEMDSSSVDQITKLVKHIYTAANSTVSTLIAREAQVSSCQGQLIPASEIEGAKAVVLKAPFRSGFSGSISFVLDAKSAAILADLILGGEGEGKTDLAEGDDDAVRELFGQVLGNAAPSITSTAGIDVGFEALSLSPVRAGGLEGALGRGKLYIATGQVKVDGVLDTKLHVVIDNLTASGIVEALGADLEEEAPQPMAQAAPSYMQPAAQRSTAAPQRAAAPMMAPSADIRNIDLILDIEVEVMVRLGNSQMPLREIQKLRPGSIIDLDKDTDALVELVVNDRVIAKGELVVVSSDHFALRVTEISSPTERIRSLGGE